MSNFSPLRIPSEPRWKPCHKSRALDLPASVKGWLLDPDSLTERLINVSQGHFRVDVLKQVYAKPKLSEARRLNLKPTEWALIREVALLCHEQPWVYARSIVPRKTIVGGTHHLKSIGSRPLGAALFNDPSMHRKVVDIATIPATELSLYVNLKQHVNPKQTVNREEHYSTPPSLHIHAPTIWARRSLFTVGGQPLLVAEMFLPPLFNQAPTSHPKDRRLIR